MQAMQVQAMQQAAQAQQLQQQFQQAQAQAQQEYMPTPSKFKLRSKLLRVYAMTRAVARPSGISTCRAHCQSTQAHRRNLLDASQLQKHVLREQNCQI
jgi:hypothetical protein